MATKTWSDVDIHLNIDGSGNVIVRRQDEALRQSILNILSTMRGERVRTDIGSGVYSLLFEPVNDETAEDIQEAIRFSLSEFENRINLLNVQVRPNEDERYYEVIIRFRERTSISMQEIRSFLEQQN